MELRWKRKEVFCPFAPNFNFSVWQSRVHKLSIQTYIITHDGDDGDDDDDYDNKLYMINDKW